MLMIKSQELAFSFIDSSLVETTKTSAPFYLAISALLGELEIAITLWPIALASLIPIVPKPPIPIIPMLLDFSLFKAPQYFNGS